MWSEQYENLSKADQSDFGRLANYLLAHTYLVRDVYKVDKQYTDRSEDYRKATRMFELLRDYFAVADYRLEKDDMYGVISLITTEHNRARIIGKFTTLFLYVCRLIYEDGREQGDSSYIVRTDTATVVQKMRDFGLLQKGKHAWQTELYPALLFLSHFNIIQKTDNAWSNEGNGILIFPSILTIVSNQSINDVMVELEELKVQPSETETDENFEDETNQDDIF
ncbi:MAG: DUF4194 domain-containing protein [Clostridium sp.]|jgi:hypothetical protein|nr:DUF4194 domain-containing protein [Clostridium sp.]